MQVVAALLLCIVRTVHGFSAQNATCQVHTTKEISGTKSTSSVWALFQQLQSHGQVHTLSPLKALSTFFLAFNNLHSGHLFVNCAGPGGISEMMSERQPLVVHGTVQRKAVVKRRQRNLVVLSAKVLERLDLPTVSYESRDLLSGLISPTRLKALLSADAPAKSYNPYSFFDICFWCVRDKNVRMTVPVLTSLVVWGVGWGVIQTLFPVLRATLQPLDQLCQALLTPVSFMLVFRLGRSATRFWDARAALGQMVAKCREAASLAIAAGAHCPDLRDEFCRWVAVFPISVKSYLRKEPGMLNELHPLLEEHDAKELIADNFQPLTVLSKLRELAFRASSEVDAEPAVRAQVYTSLNAACNGLNDAWGAMERILNTPLPFAYVAHLRVYLLIYLYMRFMTSVAIQGWVALPGLFVLSSGLLGIEAASVECETPFRRKPNHLRLGLMSHIVSENVAQMLYGSRALKPR